MALEARKGVNEKALPPHKKSAKNGEHEKKARMTLTRGGSGNSESKGVPNPVRKAEQVLFQNTEAGGPRSCRQPERATPIGFPYKIKRNHLRMIGTLKFRGELLGHLKKKRQRQAKEEQTLSSLKKNCGPSERKREHTWGGGVGSKAESRKKGTREIGSPRDATSKNAK